MKAGEIPVIVDVPPDNNAIPAIDRKPLPIVFEQVPSVATVPQMVPVLNVPVAAGPVTVTPALAAAGFATKNVLNREAFWSPSLMGY